MLPTATIVALALAACGAAIVVITRQSSVRGAVSGMAVAATSILGLGPAALAPLAVFVLGGGALTRLGGGRKRAMAVAEPNAGTRGARHVAAKLAIPAIVAIVAWAGEGSIGLASKLSIAFAAALAGALADTAGTEVGPLGRGPAFGLRRNGLVRLDHGSVGAMSAAGLAATAAGSAAVVATAMASGLIDGIHLGALVAVAGFGAAVLESLIANSTMGRRLGHFGRNVFVSAVATALGLGVALSGMGKP
jgi:uncharacterized membrane protein